MHSEVHVLHRMDHNIDELHTCHLRYRQTEQRTQQNMYQVSEMNMVEVSQEAILKLSSYHEVNVSIFTLEVVHQFFKAMLFLAHLQCKYKY